MKLNASVLICCCLVMLFIVCQAFIPAPVLPSVPAENHILSDSAPTETPTPTETPVSQTPTVEAPAILTDLLTNVRIKTTDSFDSLDRWMKWNDGTGDLSEGNFVLTGQKGWMSGLEFIQRVGPGEGLVLSFKSDKNNNFDSEFVFALGDWQTDTFRQFGVYNGVRPKADLYQGKNALGFRSLNGNLTIKTDTWYKLLMAVGKNGEFLAVIWNPDNPTQKDTYHEVLGKKWADLDYKFQAKASAGETVYLDDFILFGFDDIKKPGK